MSQKIDIRERRYNGVDYDTLHPETNINMVLDSSNNNVGEVNGILCGDGNGNIVGATISNPNLLDNPWFTINQRGAGLSLSPTPNNQYIVDRWKLGYVNTAGTYQVTTNGLSITPNSQNYYTTLTQFIDTDRAQNLDGRELTFSIKLSDGTIKTGLITRIKATDQIFIRDSQFVVYFTDAESIMIRILSSCTLRAVKIEVGSVSTLANDVAPNYTTELLKCQRYFYRIKMGNTNAFIAQGIVSADNISAWMLLNVPEMREIPNLTMSGAFRTVGANIGTVQTMSIATYCSGSLRIDLTTTSAGAKGQPIFLAADNDINAYIDLSADL